MNDGPELASGVLAPFPMLKRGLEFLQQSILPAWAEADRRAMRYQRRHRAVAKWAIFAGSAAIVLGIGQLFCATFASHPWRQTLVAMELLAALAAAVAVVTGFRKRTQRDWLVYRQTAERLRSLKFDALARPELWCDFTAWCDWIKVEVEELRRLDHHGAEQWVKSGHAEARPPRLPPCPVPGPEVAALASYYRLKRQTYQQKSFFQRRAAEHNHDLWLFRLRVPTYLFFISVLLVLVHGGMDFFAHGETKGFPWALFLVALAAGLPVAGFGLRAWFSAFELPRRASLFESKGHQLEDAIQNMQRDERDLEKTLFHITQGEHFFQTEHREWCRLISEAEWFL